jgi:hypothetical protein
MAKTLHKQNLITILSVTILVGIEILGASLAAGWAIGGLMQLGRETTLGIVALCLAGGAWATVKFVRNAVKIEPIYD